VERLLAADAEGAGFLTGTPGELLKSTFDDRGPATLSGRTISHFRIGEPLGSGGMGVVYAAEDTRLGRPVALKFLAPELVRDPAAKARFLTEARAASALDHANLCTILDVGESEDGLLFLAMPRYDGESLERRITRGPLPVEDALEIAVQAARGLAKAHENGIIHRDIKPGNLFVTRDGVVKILDFGIAKLSGETGHTRRGAILGTPSYMAPEQTRGEMVDARADVWSLGVVLYEMLAGRRPFAGGSGAAVVHAVLHETPEALTHLRPGMPAELDRMISRMLAKDPGQRPADAAEALVDLRSASGLPATGSLSPSAPRQPRRWLAWAVLGAVALAAGIAVGLLAWRRGGAAPDLLPGQIVQLTDLPGVETLVQRPLEVQDGVQAAWSPHGVRIAFWGVAQPGNRRAIWTIPVDGGSPVTVVDDAFYNWSPVWSPDGRFLYFASNRSGSMNLWRVAVDERSGRVSSPPQPITTSSEWSALPSLSRDGHRLIYATESSRRFVELVPFNPETAQVDGPPALAYQGARAILSCDVSPDGAWLALGASSPTEDLLLIRPDGGDLRQLTNDLARDRTPYWSPDGSRILFASNRSGKYEAWTIRPDGSGLTRITHLPDQPVLYPFWSPDGKQIGFYYSSRGTALLDLLRPQSRPRMIPRGRRRADQRPLPGRERQQRSPQLRPRAGRL
jgi:serine/threonine protein kinase/Tol biopolymer transport system component